MVRAVIGNFEETNIRVWGDGWLNFLDVERGVHKDNSVTTILFKF